MTNVDEHTLVAFEVVAQTFKLSEQALLRILEALTKLLENKEQDPKDYILDGNTKDGKEDYSFFFSTAQASVIEKALKNIVERKNSELEK
ncbi:hypothetical protein [Bacillus cereus]|uniref:hypothetical protein n=1 Tax=Bacillus cereus TaxID=1396 RepID=UPI000BF9E41D|nr:hypothetical protein [Bacillus cereus]PEX82245.1 hypothetical protein CN450_22580 [Bacillus cereus]